MNNRDDHIASAFSLRASSSGEHSAPHYGRARMPGARDGKQNRLDVPKAAREGDKLGFYIDRATLTGPRGGKRRVVVGYMRTSDSALASHNLAQAYAQFSLETDDRELAAYSLAQALGRRGRLAGIARMPRIKHVPEREDAMARAAGQTLPTGYQLREPKITHDGECPCLDCRALRYHARPRGVAGIASKIDAMPAEQGTQREAVANLGALLRTAAGAPPRIGLGRERLNRG